MLLNTRGKRIRLQALRNAQLAIGAAEQPPGSNRGPEIDAWLRLAGAASPNPWCGAFDYAMKRMAGSSAVREIAFPASVLSWVETADQQRWKVARPLRGDDVAFSWHGHTPHPRDHIGIVERVLALPRLRRDGLSWKYWIRTVEGNTGDQVRRRWRWVDPRDVAFVRIPG